MAMPQRPSLRPPPTLLKLLAACGLAVVLSSASAYASTDEFPGPDPETPEIDCNTYTGGQGSSDTARETTALPVDVARATLVSNRGHLDGIGHRTHGGTALQGFTTGGNPAGYVLSEISVVLEAPSDQTSMEIWTQKGTPLTYRPGKLLYRLISPPPMPTCEPVTFTAPPGTTLAPNTTYYARYVDAGVIAWDYDRQLDSGTATGWSLEDGLMSQSLGANAYTRYRPNGIIAIRGIALLGTARDGHGPVGEGRAGRSDAVVVGTGLRRPDLGDQVPGAPQGVVCSCLGLWSVGRCG